MYFAANRNYTTIWSNNNNYKFVVLLFITSDSKPIMCIIIMKAEMLSYEQIQGININTLFINSSDKITENTSLDKYYPKGSMCYFRWKYVLYIITYFFGSRINQLILIKYLKNIDELEFLTNL